MQPRQEFTHPKGLFHRDACEELKTGGLIESRPQDHVMCVLCAHDEKGALKPNGNAQYIDRVNLEEHLGAKRHVERLQEMALGLRAVPRPYGPLDQWIIESYPQRRQYLCRPCQLNEDGTLRQTPRCHEMTIHSARAHMETSQHIKREADGRLARYMKTL